jgi:hypothetical protein
MRRNKTYRGEPTKRMKELEQKKFKVRLVFLIASVCFAQGVMAQTNTITVTPQPEAQVSEEAPDSWSPEGLSTVTKETEIEETGYIKEVKPAVEKKVNSEIRTVKITDTEAGAKAFIYQHESENVPCKINGGAVNCEYEGRLACGLGQSLPCSNLTSVCDLADRECQEIFWDNYAKRRYGSWAKAKEFWVANRWW